MHKIKVIKTITDKKVKKIKFQSEVNDWNTLLGVKMLELKHDLIWVSKWNIFDKFKGLTIY